MSLQKLKWFAFVLGLIASTTSSSFAGVVTIVAFNDIQINVSGSPVTDANSETLYIANTGGNESQVMIGFGVSGLGANPNIQSAELTLFNVGGAGTAEINAFGSIDNGDGQFSLTDYLLSVNNPILISSSSSITANAMSPVTITLDPTLFPQFNGFPFYVRLAALNSSQLAFAGTANTQLPHATLSLVTAVPEPSSLLTMAIAISTVGIVHLRRRKDSCKGS